MNRGLGVCVGRAVGMLSRSESLAPERRLDPAREIRGLERLQDVIVRAEIEHLLLYDRPFLRRHDNDGRGGMTLLMTKREDGAIAIELRHQQIHHEQIDVLRGSDVQRVLAVEGLEDAIPVALEQQSHQRPRRRFIVRDQH